jgi:class 3 adenylate cyclase
MNKYMISAVQNYVEKQSNQCKLLHDRFIHAGNYSTNLAAIKKGFGFLNIATDSLTVFENRANFIIWLGRRLAEYTGYELPLYLGHKKMGLPVPEALLEKCPHAVVRLVENKGKQRYLQDLTKEFKKVSFSSEIFLAVHKCIMLSRVESLLPGLLSDIDRLGFTSIKDALKKVPQVYLDYLSENSLMKLSKKMSSVLHGITAKLEQELKNIELYSLRLKEQLQDLYLEADRGLRNIIDNEVEKNTDVKIVTQKTSNLFSRLDRLFLGNIYHLKDYERRRQEILLILKQEEDFKYSIEKREFNKRKKIGEIYDEFMFYHKFGALTRDEEKLFTKALTYEFEQLHRKKSPSLALLNRFEKRGLLSVELDFEGIIMAYHDLVRDHIVPQYIAQCLLDLVSCFPPADDQPSRVIRDCAHLKVLSLEGKNILSVPAETQAYPEDLTKYIAAFQKCITIMVYDIRGSSYMGIKLHNAAKEQRIKYKFAKEMADIVKRHGGFLLKDTGDGGLVWFAENSGTLYNHLYTESTTGRGIKLRSSIFSGAEFDLIPAADAAKRAILCARDMVQRAEEFIRANFMHYREWFAEVAERTLELDGITYALLPPEFKSLFRIGIGIASGIPNRDVVFSANSFGDPDLVGPIISDANLYSMERQPGRSVIICDFPSLTNVLLNIEGYDYPIDEDDFEKYIKMVEDFRRNNHGYKFSDHKIAIMPRGIHYMEELNKMKAVAGDELSEIWIGKDTLYNNKKKKIKPVYEVINI